MEFKVSEEQVKALETELDQTDRAINEKETLKSQCEHRIVKESSAVDFFREVETMVKEVLETYGIF